MQIKINLDYDMEVGNLMEITAELRSKCISFYKEKFYGNGILAFGIIYNCRSPKLDHRLRKRFDKITKTLYFDVMGEFEKIIQVDDEKKAILIAREFLLASPTFMGYKTKIPDFDFEKFNNDWHLLFSDPTP